LEVAIIKEMLVKATASVRLASRRLASGLPTLGFAQDYSKEEKHRLELDAMTSIRNLLKNENPSVGTEFFDLFNEYEKEETNEAKTVRILTS
jgi:hypothetical protein